MARRTQQTKRVLATVLFTDIVGSTQVAEEMGDARWKELLERHHGLFRAHLKAHGGREQDTAGDGFFAAFDQPAAAIRCARAIVEDVQKLGIDIRAGVHVGECEQVGGKLGGIAVHLGARVMSLAGAAEILVSGTTRELVSGAGFSFESRGIQSLKGIEGEWPVWALTATDDTPTPAPLPPETASARRAAVTPAPVLARPRIRLLIAAAALALIVSALFVVLRPTGSLERIPPNHVGMIDASSAEITDVFPVGRNPGTVVASDTAAWIARLEAGVVAELSRDGGSIETVAVDGHPSALTVDDSGRVWALNGVEGSLKRIDVRNHRVDRSLGLGTGSRDVASGLGAIWVTNAIDRELLRVDPRTGEIERLPLTGTEEPASITVGEGSVWIVDGLELLRVDPTTGAIERVTLRVRGDDVIAGAGGVWVSHSSSDVLTRVDPEGLTVVTQIEVGNGPATMALHEGSLWVVLREEGGIAEIDVASDSVIAKRRLAVRPSGISAAAGVVWVSVQGD